MHKGRCGICGGEGCCECDTVCPICGAWTKSCGCGYNKKGKRGRKKRMNPGCPFRDGRGCGDCMFNEGQLGINCSYDPECDGPPKDYQIQKEKG